MAWPVVALVVGAALSIGSSLMAGKAAKKAAAAQAAAYRKAAEYERISLAFKLDDMSKAGDRFMGTQRVSAAASGVVISSGSPLLAAIESRKNIEQDIWRTKISGELHAKATESGAAVAEVQGNAAMKSAYFQAGSTLFSAIGQAYSPGAPAGSGAGKVA